LIDKVSYFDIVLIKAIRCFCGFLATQNGNFIRWEPYRANKDIIAVLRVTRGTAFYIIMEKY